MPSPSVLGNDFPGYTFMIITFSLIFVGVHQYRKQSGGQITFGKAFLMGTLMALLGSAFYVVTWLYYYENYMPDFMEKYSAHVLQVAAEKGATPDELASKTTEMQSFTEQYKNNSIFRTLVTLMEIFPVGLLVSLVSALVLRRGNKTE